MPEKGSESKTKPGNSFTALKHINQALTSCRNQTELFDRVCEALVEKGNFKMAWVAWQDSDSGQFAPVARCGDRGFLEEMTVEAGDWEPVAQAFQSGQVGIYQDVQLDPGPHSWAEPLNRHGYRSLVAVPISAHGKVGGTLAAASDQPHFFQNLELEMLAQAGEDISFALEHLRREQIQIETQQRLKNELEFLDAVLNGLPGILYLVDQSGRILRWNSRLEATTGYTSDQIRGMSPVQFFPADEHERVQNSIAEIFASGSSELEAHLKTRDNQLIPYRFSGYRSIIQGEPCLVGIGLDRTESLRAEREKLSSQQRFQLLAEVTHDAIWDYQIESDLIEWNRGFFSLTGFEGSGPASCFKGWASLLHPEESQELLASLGEAMKHGATSWSREHRFARKDGGYAWVLDQAYLVRDEDGNLIRLIGGMTDLSAQKKALERIATQAALIDQARDAIIVHDLDNRIISWSKGAEGVFGWSEAEVVGRRLDEVVQDEPEVFETARLAVLEHGVWTGEVPKRNRRGERLTIDSRWTLLRDAQGRPQSVLTLGSDITDRKKIEAQFLRAQRLESIGTLAGGVAHDLNNILTPILMSASLLKMEEEDEEKLESLSLIESCAERGAQMVKQVLSFARGVEGERLPLSVKELILDAIKIIKDTFPKNIQVHPVLPPNTWLVSGDATQLQQVLLNLCVNSRDAMPDGGRLTLEVSNIQLDGQYAAFHPEATPGPYVRVQIEDNGSGMAPEVAEKIFDPFFTTKELGKGTGLGLSTSLAIVKSHSGVLRCYSEPGSGTRFEIYLPALSTDSGQEDSFRGDEVRRGSGELILVIEDESTVRQVTQQTLEAFGYRVLLAEDGAEGIALYATHRSEIALVLTDMMMPILDGPSTIRALRRIDPKVPLIAASGLGEHAENLRSNRDGGVEHFLPKPYTAYALLTMVQEVLDISAGKGSASANT
ncbi:PAS domain S-box protein [bacterium]|nr:PAS domain S-box protein [bacterium]